MPQAEPSALHCGALPQYPPVHLPVQHSAALLHVMPSGLHGGVREFRRARKVIGDDDYPGGFCLVFGVHAVFAGASRAAS